MTYKLLLLTAVILTFQTTSFCQQIETTPLDWQNIKNSIESSKIVEPVKWGDFTIFSIKNINKFLYKVEISGRVFELRTPVPTELQTLFRLSPSELQKNTDNTNANNAVVQSTDVQSNIEKAFTTTPERGPGDNPTEFEKGLTELQTDFQKYTQNLKNFSSNLLTLKQNRNLLIAIAQKDLSQIDISDEVDKLNINVETSKTDYSTLKQSFLLMNEKLAFIKTKATTDPEKASIDAIVSNLKNVDDLIEEEGFLSLINDVDYLQGELKNPNNFIVNSPPVQMDGDIASFDVKITPSATRTLGPYRNPIEFKFDVPAKGGLKVDFSVGPTLSFGKNAKDQLYYLEKTSNSDMVTLKGRNNNNNISPGIGAFMHAYPRSGKFTSIGGMFGIGAGFQNTSTTNFNIYFGLTGVLGKTQRIMISSGVSYLRVERIKNDQFEEGIKYPVSEINIDNVTEKVYKPSFFFSISYNLTNRVEVVK